jgi:hypothetical protein
MKDNKDIILCIGRVDRNQDLVPYLKELFKMANREGLKGIEYKELIITEPKGDDPLSDYLIYVVREGTEQEVRENEMRIEKEIKYITSMIVEALDEADPKREY